MKTKKIGVCLTALALVASAGCGGNGDGDGKADSSITIGIKFDQPGLGQKEGSNYAGFDVEVAKYVAKELGYDDVTFVETPTPQRETMLQSGQVDMIFATYSITEERAQRVGFAGPYLIAGQAILVRSDETEITGPDTLNGHTVCAVTGSVPTENLKKNFDVEMLEFDSYSKCVEAVAGGAAEAVSTDDAILAGYAAQSQYNGKLKVVGEPFSVEKYGVGIKKGDTELCQKINDALQKMVESGAWDEALAKTLGKAGFEPTPSSNPPETGCV